MASGRGPSSKPAGRLYEAAIKQGDPDAECAMGACYVRGEGVEKNFPFAVACFHRAAEAGCAGGLRALGGCYEIGLGVERSLHKAIHNYSLAAEHGDIEALLILAELYSRGDEAILLAPDPAKAAEFLARASALGSHEARAQLEVIQGQLEEAERAQHARCLRVIVSSREQPIRVMAY